jgi:hypothetical protein
MIVPVRKARRRVPPVRQPPDEWRESGNKEHAKADWHWRFTTADARSMC